MSAIGIGTLVYGIIQGAEQGWTHATVIAAFVVTLSLAPLDREATANPSLPSDEERQ